VLFIVLCVVLSLSILARLGVFRASAIVGPERLGLDESARELLFILVLAIVAGYLFTASLAPFIRASSEPMKILLANSILEGAGFVLLLLLNATLRRQAFARLGLTFRHLLRAFIVAPASLGLLLPLVLLISLAITALLQHLQKPLPMHPLLKLIQNSRDPKLIALLIVSASVLAPLAEELLFRAHVQTILARLFLRLQRPREFPPVVPSPGSPGEALFPDAITYSPDHPSPLDPALEIKNQKSKIKNPSLPRWLAVITTAILFALAHRQLPFMPPLFVLAVGLGYVYERTGNLWACIGIHSLFNTIQIVLFLSVHQ